MPFELFLSRAVRGMNEKLKQNRLLRAQTVEFAELHSRNAKDISDMSKNVCQSF